MKRIEGSCCLAAAAAESSESCAREGVLEAVGVGPVWLRTDSWGAVVSARERVMSWGGVEGGCSAAADGDVGVVGAGVCVCGPARGAVWLREGGGRAKSSDEREAAAAAAGEAGGEVVEVVAEVVAEAVWARGRERGGSGLSCECRCRACVYVLR